MKRIHKTALIIALVALSVALVSCKACRDRNVNLGKDKNPVMLAFMPAPDPLIVKENAETVADSMEDFTGLEVEPVIAGNFVSIVDGLAAKNIDAAFMNPLGYLLAKDWGKAKAVFQFKGPDGRSVYKSAIIANVKSGIKSLKDINGKSIAYTEPFSMAGYLMPLEMLTAKGVKPSSTSFAGNYSEVVERVYKGEVDAGAIFYCERDPDGRINDARLGLVNKYSDLLDNVNVIEISGPIPNPVVVFRNDLPTDVEKKLVAGFNKIAADQKDMDALNKLYGARGMAVANEKNFDMIEKLLRKLGKDIQEVVPGAVTFYRKHFWNNVPEQQ